MWAQNKEHRVLSQNQKDRICSILSVGCDRQTAAGIVECNVIDILNAIDTLQRFATQVRRSEALAELSHMQNILNATKDGKYWRASVWWLERRSPERFGRRPAGAVTPKQLEQAVDIWNDVMLQEFNTPADRTRIESCLETLTASFELILDAQGSATLLKRHIERLQLKHEQTTEADMPDALELNSLEDATQHDHREPQDNQSDSP
jgi:hypothetical protein